jgi:glycine oxidase
LLARDANALLYNRNVKTWDAIILGGGVIGLSLAWRLKAHRLSVLVVEKHEPAREASFAAGGMIASYDPQIPDVLRPLVTASAEMYPGFVHELQEESGDSADLRDAGTIAYCKDGDLPPGAGARQVTDADLARMEPLLLYRGYAWFLPERSVDPRGLSRAVLKAARCRGVDFVTGSPVTEVLVAQNRAAGVATTHSAYAAGVVVNCAGAWAAQIRPFPVPTRPVKGQMVCLISQAGTQHARPLVEHVVRTPGIYIIPRTDGRILLGATVEDAGFDKQVDPGTIQGLYKSGVDAVPELATMRIHDAWAGLRPGSPDNLPIIGQTSLPGYYAATGHYRDGILLAPITAHLMAQLITGCKADCDLNPFSPLRFE